MTTINDQERWLQALEVMKLHGDSCLLHVAEQMDIRAKAGDEAGVKSWMQVAACIDEVSSAKFQ